MKLVGLEYLHAILKPIIDDIFEENKVILASPRMLLRYAGAVAAPGARKPLLQPLVAASAAAAYWYLNVLAPREGLRDRPDKDHG